MSKDIVEKLRKRAAEAQSSELWSLCEQAAAAIEALRAERDEYLRTSDYWFRKHQEAGAERDAAREALTYAASGLEMAYDALDKGFYDEAMLHVGHHHAKARAALAAKEKA